MKRYRLTFFLILAAAFVFRLWFITTLPLSGDESYHWEWSRNLAFGYYDHPGLTAYLIRLCTWLCGHSTEFSVRLTALLMLTGTAVICFLFARRIVTDRGGSEEAAERAGFLAGLQILVVPVFAAFSVYVSTDPPLIFFSSLTLYLLYRALEDGRWSFWIGAGVAFGLAILSKFLGFFLLGAAGLFVLLSARDRRWLKRPQGYVALLCALAVFSPFLWWNATHGWATFMFNFVYRQSQRGFSPEHSAELLMSQALALSPGIFAFALFGLYRSIRDWLIRRDRASLFLGVSSLLPLAYFLYASFYRRVGLHWPAVAWIGALVYLSCYWGTAKVDGARRGQRALKMLSLALCVLMTASMHLLVHIPPRWIRFDWRYSGDPGRINTSELNERFGWRELGKRVYEVREEMQGRVFVICTKYGLASNVAFYTPGQIRAYLWSPRKTHGENYRFWDDFSLLKSMDAVFVAKSESKARGSVRKLKEHFRRVDKPERLPIIVEGDEVRSFYLIRCYEFNGVEPDF